jgi:RNA polymerase sigma-70 factor, ECF subfamily
LGIQARDARREVPLYENGFPEITTAALAAQLMGTLTSPSTAAARVEMKMRVLDVLNAMSPADREVLALRHFEQLSNLEISHVLGITPTAACNRYIRAVERFRRTLTLLPG